MRKIIVFTIIAISWLGCQDECTNCEEYTRMLALYIKVNGTAKDSITFISGNIYNVITGTRTVFTTEKQDSVYSGKTILYEDITSGEIELTVTFKSGANKSITQNLSDKIDFSVSRVQIMTLNMTVGLLDLEITIPEYQPGQEIEDDLTIK